MWRAKLVDVGVREPWNTANDPPRAFARTPPVQRAFEPITRGLMGFGILKQGQAPFGLPATGPRRDAQFTRDALAWRTAVEDSQHGGTALAGRGSSRIARVRFDEPPADILLDSVAVGERIAPAAVSCHQAA